MLRKTLPYLFLLLVLAGGCSKDMPNQPVGNKTPRTYLWLFPDSTLRQGNSRQRIRWWGDDPDGVIRGYLFASGKLSLTGPAADTITWHWVTRNDTLLAFPLLVRQDTFQVVVRAVDNTFTSAMTEQASVRLAPVPYVDANDNGVLDAGEELPTLLGAMDPKGATLGMPLLNQPPSIVFAQNPNDPTVVMQQPETTFTAATFSWVGSDPDGNATIAGYEIALNSATDSSRWVSLPGTIKLISLVVPRPRSDTASSEVDADLYSGLFSTTRQYRGTIGHLRLDAQNTFYIRARDVAGDVSPTIQMPAAGRGWFVKKPHGKLLIVSDYIGSDSAATLTFYRNLMPQIGSAFSEFEVLNIGRGLTAQQKKENKVGTMVPPFIDPGFLSTLHLFDVVYWYTEQYPSLGVAQYPLFQYVRDASHHGKVIFSTMFENSTDPRGALKDFAPIDSVSSVDLSTSRLLPTLGDTRIPTGYSVYPDSADLGDLYPPLRFGGPPQANFSVFLRPVYKRADARYLYHIQPDTRTPLRYTFTPTLNELKSVSGIGDAIWTCGVNGTILASSTGGVTWKAQTSGSGANLSAIQMLDASSGWIAGDQGTILKTDDGGATWGDRSVLALQDGLALWFSTPANGVVAGTNGFLIRTTNGGTSWNSPNSRTNKTIRSVHFADASTGVAVGDSGLIIRTTDGGGSWSIVPSITASRLNAVRFVPGLSTGFAVGNAGQLLRTSDGGASWTAQAGLPGVELRSVFLLNQTTGIITGANGSIFMSVDGFTSWTPRPSGVGQHLDGAYLMNASEGVALGTAGIVIRTANGGSSWGTVPAGLLNVGVVDGVGSDGHRSFAFIGLPLHFLNGDPVALKELLRHLMIQDFGL
jgi:photosystem II stability/assembly factor-like uncharacterized protein